MTSKGRNIWDTLCGDVISSTVHNTTISQESVGVKTMTGCPKNSPAHLTLNKNHAMGLVTSEANHIYIKKKSDAVIGLATSVADTRISVHTTTSNDSLTYCCSTTDMADIVGTNSLGTDRTTVIKFGCAPSTKHESCFDRPHLPVRKRLEYDQVFNSKSFMQFERRETETLCTLQSTSSSTMRNDKYEGNFKRNFAMQQIVLDNKASSTLLNRTDISNFGDISDSVYQQLSSDSDAISKIPVCSFPYRTSKLRRPWDQDSVIKQNCQTDVSAVPLSLFSTSTIQTNADISKNEIKSKQSGFSDCASSALSFEGFSKSSYTNGKRLNATARRCGGLDFPKDERDVQFQLQLSEDFVTKADVGTMTFDFELNDNKKLNHLFGISHTCQGPFIAEGLPALDKYHDCNDEGFHESPIVIEDNIESLDGIIVDDDLQNLSLNFESNDDVDKESFELLPNNLLLELCEKKFPDLVTSEQSESDRLVSMDRASIMIELKQWKGLTCENMETRYLNVNNRFTDTDVTPPRTSNISAAVGHSCNRTLEPSNTGFKIYNCCDKIHNKSGLVSLDYGVPDMNKTRIVPDNELFNSRETSVKSKDILNESVITDFLVNNGEQITFQKVVPCDCQKTTDTVDETHSVGTISSPRSNCFTDNVPRELTTSTKCNSTSYSDHSKISEIAAALVASSADAGERSRGALTLQKIEEFLETQDKDDVLFSTGLQSTEIDLAESDSSLKIAETECFGISDVCKGGYDHEVCSNYYISCKIGEKGTAKSVESLSRKTDMRLQEKTGKAEKSENKKKSPKKRPARMLSELANSEGFMTEKRPSRCTDSLFVDPRLLSREERALQMVHMQMTKMEVEDELKKLRKKKKRTEETGDKDKTMQENKAAMHKHDGGAAHEKMELNLWQNQESLNCSKLTQKKKVKIKKVFPADIEKFKSVEDVEDRFYKESKALIKQTKDNEICLYGPQSADAKDAMMSVHHGSVTSLDSLMNKSDDVLKLSLLSGRSITLPVSVSYQSCSVESEECQTVPFVPPEVKRLIPSYTAGETVLHKAARLGYPEIVLWCCQSGHVDVNARDNLAYTPLHESCFNSELSIAKYLLHYGADVNASSRVDGRRPLHEAVESDCLAMVRLLLSAGADVNLTTYSGKTVKEMSKSQGMKDFITAYLADLNGTDDESTEVGWELAPVWNDFFENSEDDIFSDVPSYDPKSDEFYMECSIRPI